MEANIMKSHISRPFLREVEMEFNRAYPYLKIEFPNNGGAPSEGGISDGMERDMLKRRARILLKEDVKIADDMKVSDLEEILQDTLAVSVQVFRKSSKTWLATKMTRNWTLKQQNDYGKELAPGEEG
jgi:hypothetical protein